MVIDATHTTDTDHDTSCSLTLKHYSEATLLSYCARAGGAGTPSSALTAPPAGSARCAATAACRQSASFRSKAACFSLSLGFQVSSATAWRSSMPAPAEGAVRVG